MTAAATKVGEEIAKETLGDERIARRARAQSMT